MSKTKSFIFQGKQSFSSSKLEQLSKKFTELNKSETNIESHEIYFVEIKHRFLIKNTTCELLDHHNELNQKKKYYRFFIQI